MIGRSILLTAVCFLYSNQLLADGPPPARDTEQRLKALEAKVDRMLTILEGRQKAQPTPAFGAKHLELLQQARETLLSKSNEAQKAYVDFRLHSPSPFRSGNGTNDLVKERIAKLTALLDDARTQENDTATRSALVKKVGDSEKDARAFLVLLQRRGVDIDAMRRVVGGNPSALDLVRSYGESLSPESALLKQKIQALEQLIDSEKKEAREMLVYQFTEQQLRTTRDQTQKILDAIVSQLEKIDVMRGFHIQPKP